MPEDGTINNKFGVYQNVCCGQEIIIREGARFPACPKHPDLTTTWNPIDADIVDLTVLKKNEADSAA